MNLVRHAYYIRRKAATAATVLVLASVAAGCGRGRDDAASNRGSGATGGGFPIEVEHAFGVTVVPATPTRIVTIGYTEQDAALALGIAREGRRARASGPGPGRHPRRHGSVGDHLSRLT